VSSLFTREFACGCIEVRLSGEIGDAPIEWQAPIQWRADAGASHLIGSMAAASRIRDLEISYDRQPLEATKQRIIDSSVQYVCERVYSV